MSGTYPPYGYSDPRRSYGEASGYDEASGYGEDQWYGGGGGYGDAAAPATGARHPGQSQHGYGGPGYGQSGHAESGHAESGYGTAGYGGPGYGGPGYGGSGYGGSGYDQAAAQSRYAGATTVPAQGYPAHEADPYGQGPAYPEPAGHGSPTRYEGYQGYPEGQDGWSGRRSGRVAAPPEEVDADRFRTTTYAEPEPARRRGRGPAFALTAVAVVLALAGLGGWLVARPVLDQWPATLSTPEKLAGLELSTEPALRQAADEIAADIRQDVKVDGAVAAFYHDPASPDRIVALVGGTAFLASPKAELSEAFRSAQAEGMSMGEVVPADAGPLGGLARCAAAEQQGDGDTKVPLSVCAWADHGSLLIGLFFHRPVDESAALLRTIRAEMLNR